MEFTREAEEEGFKTLKHNKRILFQRMAPYPQRKVITFNRYNADFAFDINYGDLSFLSQDEIRLDSACSFFLFFLLAGVLERFSVQKLNHLNSVNDISGLIIKC